MSTSSSPVFGRLLTRGKLPVVTVSVLVAAAAIAGLLLGGWARIDASPTVKAAAAPTQITEAGVRLDLPSGWARGGGANIPGFTRPLQLHNADQNLRAAVERLPATSSTLLPAALLRTLKDARGVVLGAEPHLVGRFPGYRYTVQRGSQLILYTAPTTTGITTVACLSTLYVGFPPGCEALASAVTAPGSRALEPGKSAAFFSHLSTAVTELNTARSRGARELSTAASATDQAAAAEGLAQAHKGAGAALAPLTSRGDGMPSDTVGALIATGTAYEALATAARARSPEPYADASRAVQGAEADLRLTIANAAKAAGAASRRAPQATSTPAAASTARSDSSTAVLTLLGASLLLATVVLAARQIRRRMR